MSDFQLPTDLRPVDAMSRAQIGVILGLESVLQASGLILTCPRCAFDGHAELQTENSPEDPIWRIDCRCRRRRVTRQDSAPMPPSGDLLLMVPEMLRPLSLEVRCPSPRCLNRPLEMHETTEGLIVTCHCGGTYHFKKTLPRIH